MMVGYGLGSITVVGQNFGASSEVLVDGQPPSQMQVVNSGQLVFDTPSSFGTTVGTHQISVQNGSQVSNAVPFTIYAAPQGPSVMQAIPGFLVGENTSDPPFIVAADVNGDGLSDVVMPGPTLANSGSIAILNGQPDGTLSAAQYIPVPITPYALAVGDVDGNGTPDLVSIVSETGNHTVSVTVLSGDGHGSFQSPVTLQTFPGIYPGPAYLADLDGDGRPDLVLGMFVNANTLWWLKNNGGGFAAPVRLAGTNPNTSQNFAVADFNLDGKPDILYAAADLSFHILLNQGNGSFHDQLAAGISGVTGVPNVMDFNLDGIPDIVVEQQISGSLLVSFSGNGDGSFTQVATLDTPGMAQLVSGDFDHDGFPDLAGPTGTEPSEIVYFLGDGRGHFTIQPVVGPEGSYAAVGDFNGDGLPDVVVPDRFNFVSLALGRKDRQFPSPLALSPATMTQLSAGDINGDGLPDLFVGGDPIGGVPGTVFLNQGAGSFQLAAHTDPLSFEIADMTGKGVADLLGGDTNLEIWPNNGTPNFSPSPVTVPQPISDITVADMDGDGHPDFISACQYSQCPGQIFYGSGSYQFNPVTVQNLTFPYIVGDFNGDGRLDILSGSGTFLNSGNRAFQQVQSNLPDLVGSLTTVGDFNGDGKDDIAFSSLDSSYISIWYSNGDGTFYEATILDAGQYPGALSVADFDGDGRIDLAVGLMNSQQACLLFNQGNGIFSRSFLASGANTVAMVASDLDRNGKPDLVIGNFALDFTNANVDVVFHK